MKMSKRLYENIKEFIQKHETEETREAYRKGEFDRSEAVKDLNRRYRFDWYWAWFRQAGQYQDLLVSEELTSDHIYSALKKIIKDL